jgi:YHS domain-containing protein
LFFPFWLQSDQEIRPLHATVSRLIFNLYPNAGAVLRNHLSLITKKNPTDMKLYLTIIAVFFSLAVMAQAEEEASRRRNFNIEDGEAIRDFDPVSIFKGKPAKGELKFAHTHKGITYFFVNEVNREEFKKAPAKYEPAYGGWCAYSMAVNGERVKVDPTTFKIIGGKIYLFYNFAGDNNLLKWNKNEKKFKTDADYYWRKKQR